MIDQEEPIQQPAKRPSYYVSLVQSVVVERVEKPVWLDCKQRPRMHWQQQFALRKHTVIAQRHRLQVSVFLLATLHLCIGNLHESTRRWSLCLRLLDPRLSHKNNISTTKLCSQWWASRSAAFDKVLVLRRANPIFLSAAGDTSPQRHPRETVLAYHSIFEM